MASPNRFRVAATLATLALSAGCDSPSASVDPNDLRGVFDKDAGAASASASTSARPRASASAPPPAPTERAPSDPGCVAAQGQPAEPRRVAGRPACRGSEVLEWRDPTGAPRYACLYSPSELSRRGELPLLVFFHGTGPGLDDPSSVAKLTDLRKHIGEADLTREGRPGFLVLGIQGRALEGSPALTFDTEHTAADNVDRVVVDHFIDEVAERKIVDARRIYAVGMGKGGEMAVTYAMLRADRVAAFAAFAPLTPHAEWICPGAPPPGLVLYRACDKIAACEGVEQWLLARDAQRAETKRIRLGDAGTEEPSCTVRNKCTPKKAESNHHRWPKGREKDVLGFLGGYVLKTP